MHCPHRLYNVGNEDPTGWVTFTKKIQQCQEESEQKVDLLIQDIWQKGTDSVHDM